MVGSDGTPGATFSPGLALPGEKEQSPPAFHGSVRTGPAAKK